MSAVRARLGIGGGGVQCDERGCVTERRSRNGQATVAQGRAEALAAGWSREGGRDLCPGHGSTEPDGAEIVGDVEYDSIRDRWRPTPKPTDPEPRGEG